MSTVIARSSDIKGPARGNAVSAPIRAVLDRVLDGQELSIPDAVRLFSVEGTELEALVGAADTLRQRAAGDDVTFVVNRNINYTNVCYMGCRFCNFAKHRSDADAELMGLPQIVQRVREAAGRGATEVCIQGGLHPDLPAGFYRDMVAAIKSELPDMHIHAFSPFEIWYGARKARQNYRSYLKELIYAGLGSMPGTAAEILDVEIRQQLTRNKLSTEDWVTVIRTAHELGLRTTSTIMYGHIDGPEHWANHLALLRDIQKDTDGFTEFVPLGFIHYKTRLYNEQPGVRPGPTREEHIRMHAVARLMLHGWIDNIQASWVKLGPELAQYMLGAGVNDLGGTLMNESISRAAGAQHGQEVLPEQMLRMIRDAGRTAVQRNSLYGRVQGFDEPIGRVQP